MVTIIDLAREVEAGVGLVTVEELLSMELFQCSYCSFRCSAWKVHMRHTFECHSSLPNFRYSCGISGCLQTFRTFGGISSHLQRKHSSYITQPENNSESSHFDTENDHVISNLHEGTDEDVAEEDISLHAPTHMMAKKSTALLLLSLKERHRLTQVALNFSIFQIKQVLKYILDDVKQSVCQKLNIDEVEVESCFEVDPFEGLETEHLQAKFYSDHLNLVVS